MTTPVQCPVCNARFRGARVCSRCGADLEPLMLLAAKAWRLRQSARQALEDGDVRRAAHLVTEAERTHTTPQGGALGILSDYLTYLDRKNDDY